MPENPSTDLVEVDETDRRRVDEVAELAARTLTAGRTVVLPTDTVYGLAARPDRPAAMAQVFALKGRRADAAVAVLCADPDDLETLADLASLGDDHARVIRGLTRRCWPGALTLVLPRHPSRRHFDLGGDPTTIGLRCPRSPLARAVAAHAGPIAATSANRSGEATPTRARQAADSLAGSVSLVIDAGPCTEPASTVLDVTARPFRVLRRGTLGPATLGLPAGWLDDDRGGHDPDRRRSRD